MEEGRVSATPEALDVIERLTAKHGPLVFLQSGGCCDGSSPLCVRRGELLIGPTTSSWATSDRPPSTSTVSRMSAGVSPRFVIDVSAGAGDTFSLEGREDLHFILVE